MSKPIQEMNSQEIQAQLQLDQLQQMLSEKENLLQLAKDAHDNAKVKELLETCGDLVTQIEMLDPDINIELKDRMLAAYVESLNAKLHQNEH